MDLDVIIAGLIYSLTDDVVCNLLSQDGIGISPLHRLSERGPQQHGDSDQGFRLDPRIVSLILRVEEPNMLAKRDTLMGYFKPRDTALILKWTRDDAEVRQLDCHYTARLGLSTNFTSRYLMKLPIQLKSAGNPAFYDPELVVVVFVMGGGGETMDIPLVVPWKIGASGIDVTTPVTYEGTWRAYPLIIVDGPITSCVITNLGTGEKLDFLGVTVANGEQRVIDLQYARKTVVDELGADCIADLTTDSDLSTWHIQEAPDAPGGINSIQVTGTGASGATAVAIRFYTRYISL